MAASGEDKVEHYIAAIAEPAQTRLRELRKTVRGAAPKDAVEVISYGMPAFALDKPFFGFAAFKKHIGVFPFSGSLLQEFAHDVDFNSRDTGIALGNAGDTSIARRRVAFTCRSTSQSRRR